MPHPPSPRPPATLTLPPQPCRYAWNKTQLEKARNEKRSQTNPWATALRGVVCAVPTAIIVIGCVTTLTTYDGASSEGEAWMIFGVISGGFWVILGGFFALRAALLAHYRLRWWRLFRVVGILVLIAGLVRCPPTWLGVQAGFTY